MVGVAGLRGLRGGDEDGGSPGSCRVIPGRHSPPLRGAPLDLPGTPLDTRALDYLFSLVRLASE